MALCIDHGYFTLTPALSHQGRGGFQQPARKYLIFLDTALHLKLWRVAIPFLLLTANPADAADNPLAQGEYLFRVAGCATCHTDEKNKGAPLAGGRALVTPFGTFYTPNITPDPETGIGRWTDEDFRRALREGKNPQGHDYYPAFPYTSYTQMTDADLLAIKRYLFGQKPVHQANKPHELAWYVRSRLTLKVWKKPFFSPGVFTPQPEQSAVWNRGAYLVNAVAHCGECHTPRNPMGGLTKSKFLAGNPNGPDGAAVPNITPDKTTGIGKWRESDLVDYLETGAKPDGDYAGDAMAEVIDNNLKHLTKEDRKAIASYVLSLPPIEHALHKKKAAKKKKEEY
jgi:mono/diheme cytochrome c family protein